MYIMMKHKNWEGDDGVKADGEFRRRLEELLGDYEALAMYYPMQQV